MTSDQMADLVTHFDHQWPEPLLYLAERAEWVRAFTDLDPEYVGAALNALHAADPTIRPTTAQFIETYRHCLSADELVQAAGRPADDARSEVAARVEKLKTEHNLTRRRA